MEFKIEKTEIYGLDKSIIASGNAMRTEIDDNTINFTEKDLKRACTLGNTKSGEGHDQFLTGIIVQFDLYAPLYMWKQLQRYHFLDFISSQSTMHRLTKFNVKDCCVDDVDKVIIDRYQQLLDMYNHSINEMNNEEKTALWRTLVASLPSGFVLGATMTTNYRQLKTIYNQRKHHKLKEWNEFCSWCEELPYFKELCLGGNNNG
jgi:hypothetical protein